MLKVYSEDNTDNWLWTNIEQKYSVSLKYIIWIEYQYVCDVFAFRVILDSLRSMIKPAEMKRSSKVIEKK